MRHRVAGKRLSRTTAHRKAMRRNLAASLFEHGTVRTTLAKAKQVRPFVERLITLARQGTLHARRRAIATLGDRAIIDKENPDQLDDKSLLQKLFEEIAPRYADRPGGYTRIIHLPERRIGDASRQVLLQLVEQAPAGKAGDEAPATASRRRKRAARRAEAAKAVAEADEQASPEDTAEADEQDDQADSGQDEEDQE